MHPFDFLGDPVRRRLLELLAKGEQPAGEVVAAIGREFGISQPAVSQHLRVLRESGFAAVRAEAQKRLYSLQREPFADIERWLAGFREKPGRKAKKGKKRAKDRPVLAKLPKRKKAKR